MRVFRIPEFYRVTVYKLSKKTFSEHLRSIIPRSVTILYILGSYVWHVARLLFGVRCRRNLLIPYSLQLYATR